MQNGLFFSGEVQRYGTGWHDFAHLKGGLGVEFGLQLEEFLGSVDPVQGVSRAREPRHVYIRWIVRMKELRE